MSSVTDLRQGRISGSVFVELALAAAGCAPACLESLRARVLRDALDGHPPPGTRTFRAAPRGWHMLSPGVHIKMLGPNTPERVIALVRLEPGAHYAAHDHPTVEECLVLSGEVRIGGLHLRTGDLHIADPGTTHEVTVAPQGALLFVRTAAARPDGPSAG
jgi:anti-sigma factor ChrR (cupin superfamily)